MEILLSSVSSDEERLLLFPCHQDYDGAWTGIFVYSVDCGWEGKGFIDPSTIENLGAKIDRSASQLVVENRLTVENGDRLWSLVDESRRRMRIQMILRLVDVTNFFKHLSSFMKRKVLDEALPLSFDKISAVLNDPTKARVFWNLQFWALPSAIVLGNCSHVVFPSRLYIPLQHLEILGHEAYATVDSDLDVMNNKQYARKVFHPFA